MTHHVHGPRIETLLWISLTCQILGEQLLAQCPPLILRTTLCRLSYFFCSSQFINTLVYVLLMCQLVVNLSQLMQFEYSYEFHVDRTRRKVLYSGTWRSVVWYTFTHLQGSGGNKIPKQAGIRQQAEVSCVRLAYSSTLKVEIVRSSETFLNLYQTTHCRITEDNTLNSLAVKSWNLRCRRKFVFENVHAVSGHHLGAQVKCLKWSSSHWALVLLRYYGVQLYEKSFTETDTDMSAGQVRFFFFCI
jgi:hypothetical protein